LIQDVGTLRFAHRSVTYFPIGQRDQTERADDDAHQANKVKPWRVTYVKNVFTTNDRVTNDTANPIAMMPAVIGPSCRRGFL